MSGNTKYERLEIVGEGTYGTVWKAKDLRTGHCVAIKKIKLEEEGVPTTAMREGKPSVHCF